jgi:sporulation protein YlmC with PRC-barrel domain
MRRTRTASNSALAFAVVLLLPPSPASAQEVSLVAPDAKEVAKGYRAEELKLRSVVNDKGEIIGRIDDFIFGRDNGPIFAVLKVGDFVGLEGELVAVPFKSLKLDDSSGQIVLPGASRPALQKLPVFLYDH